MNLKGKNFISLLDFNKEQLTQLLELAGRLKQDTRIGQPHEVLKNKTLAMIFSKPSLRTRVSFEVGIKQLGGNSILLKQDEINLGVRESVADTANVLSRYVDGIMIRTFAQSDVEELAKHSSVPVINALTDLAHPCQILADLLTIKEHFGRFKNLKLAYVGDGNNIANSLLAGCTMLGIDVSIGCPKGYEPDSLYLKECRELSLSSGSKVEVVHTAEEAVSRAHIIYTDVWTSMGQESEAVLRRNIFKKFQVNSDLLNHAVNEAIVLHCLPAHRGEEVTAEVMEAHSQVIFEQAENRLHAQKAIMASIM